MRSLFEAEPFRTIDHPRESDRFATPGKLASEARARNNDPEESRAAAASVKGLSQKQDAVLACIAGAAGPLTDHDMMARYRELMEAQGWPEQSDSGLRTRRSELSGAGFVVPAGKAKLPTGRWARRWTTPDHAYFAHLRAA